MCKNVDKYIIRKKYDLLDTKKDNPCLTFNMGGQLV